MFTLLNFEIFNDCHEVYKTDSFIKVIYFLHEFMNVSRQVITVVFKVIRGTWALFNFSK